MRQIDILYFASCPTWKRTAERVHHVIAEAGLGGSARVRLVPVETDDEARRLQFLGSPTVRVDGEDIEPGRRRAEHVSLQCRLYPAEGRLGGIPPTAWIRRALGLEDGTESETSEGEACACEGATCPQRPTS